MYTDIVWCLYVSLGASAAPVFAEDPLYIPSASLSRPRASLPLTAGTRRSTMSTPGAKSELDDKTAVQYGSYENGHDHAAQSQHDQTHHHHGENNGGQWPQTRNDGSSYNGWPPSYDAAQAHAYAARAPPAPYTPQQQSYYSGGYASGYSGYNPTTSYSWPPQAQWSQQQWSPPQSP